MTTWGSTTQSQSPSPGPKLPKTSSLGNDARWTNSTKSEGTGSKRQIQNTRLRDLRCNHYRSVEVQFPFFILRFRFA